MCCVSQNCVLVVVAAEDDTADLDPGESSSPLFYCDKLTNASAIVTQLVVLQCNQCRRGSSNDCCTINQLAPLTTDHSNPFSTFITDCLPDPGKREHHLELPAAEGDALLAGDERLSGHQRRRQPGHRRHGKSADGSRGPASRLLLLLLRGRH